MYKDDVIENSNMIDLPTWMIKLKSNNTNEISTFCEFVVSQSYSRM